MGRTRAIRQGGEEESAVLVKARKDLEALVPEAIEAYGDLIAGSKPEVRRAAAKDVLDAAGVTRVIGGSGDGGGSMSGEVVLKLVMEMGKMFGLEVSERSPGSKYSQGEGRRPEKVVSGMNEELVKKLERQS